MTQTSPEVYHDSDGVRVTSKSITAGDATYAIRNVSSVEMETVQLPSQRDQLGVVLLVAGVFLCVVTLIVHVGKQANTSAESAMHFTIAAAGAGLAIYGGIRAKPKRRPSRYVVYIMTNAGQAEVMGFNGIEPAMAVRDAIQRAM